jgi:hypothetical protein
MVYVYLAVSCMVVGIILTYIVIHVCIYLEINIVKNIWVLAIPAILSIIVNIGFIELYQKYRKK